ncbi:TPA: MFS transporter TsgA [Raoultella ornithinolytica]|nr:MFS transporter TsgA [Raoultella ornithinolytica]HAT1671155.1 MFS transporter TsgA [Raoultella ornithinolytica]
MSEFNQSKLFILSCICYAFTGALVIVTGIVMGDIAKYFNISVVSMSGVFTFLNAGILVSIFLNVWLMDLIPIKTQIVFSVVLSILCVIYLFIVKSVIGFSICMFVLGCVSGISMSIGTYIVTKIFNGKKRGSRLLITDSFFSMAGMVFPIIAAFLLTHHFSWQVVYACIAILNILILILTLTSDFSFSKLNDQNDVNNGISSTKKEKGGIAVVILSIAATCYILGQLAFIQWVPEYTTKMLEMSISESGELVGAFWLAYMLGMWFFSFLVKHFDLLIFAVVLTALATIAMFVFNNSEDPSSLKYYIFILGFISSAIYTTIITLGSMQTKISSPKIVNCILTCGTIGTMLTFIVTAPIVKKFDVHAPLVTANILYLCVFVLCIILSFFSKHKQHDKG